MSTLDQRGAWMDLALSVQVVTVWIMELVMLSEWIGCFTRCRRR